MSIEQTNIVDLIGTDRDDGVITLAISDHMDWEDEYAHLSLLQDKINTYLRFVESGEINQAYPQALGKPLVIEIVGKYDLNKAAQEFVKQAGIVVAGAGVSLRFRRLAPQD